MVLFDKINYIDQIFFVFKCFIMHSQNVCSRLNIFWNIICWLIYHQMDIKHNQTVSVYVFKQIVIISIFLNKVFVHYVTMQKFCMPLHLFCVFNNVLIITDWVCRNRNINSLFHKISYFYFSKILSFCKTLSIFFYTFDYIIQFQIIFISLF